MSRIIGVDPLAFFTNAQMLRGDCPGPGTRGMDAAGNEYLLLKSAAAIAVQGLCGFWDEAFVFTSLSLSNDIAATPVAFSRGLPTATDQFFWAQIWGMGDIRVLASAAADVALESTATAGVLDDSVTVGSFVINGAHLMVANGGAEGSIKARISYPHLSYLAR